MTESEQSTVRRLRKIFELLVRTMKTLSLYEAHNPVSEKLEIELHDRLSELLDEKGPIDLKILQDRILFDDEVVYENPERKESLAFLLSRDGIRSLVFQPGLALEEFRSLVSCLNRARVLIGGEDDLATLLWERDFESIDYIVVDELADGASGPDAGEALVGTGWPGKAEPAGGVGGGAVTLQDLRPSARLPVEGARLSDAEIEALHGELAEESTADLPSMTVELAVELAMLEPAEDERRILATALAGILDELLVQKKPEDFLRAFGRLRKLAGEVFGAEKTVADLFDLVRYALAREGQLARFLTAVEGHSELMEATRGFLAELPESAVPALIGKLGRIRQSGLRRAVSDAILVHGSLGPAQLMDRLPALLAAGENELLDELLHMVRNLPQESACPLIARLMSLGSADLARRGALILGHLRGDKVEALLFDLFEGGEPELRSLAIGALERSGNRALAPRLLKRLLEPGELELEAKEARRAMAAVGRLGGDAILPTFDELLQAKGGVWFPTRDEKELVLAVVHGVRAIASKASRAYLEKLAEGGNRMLRSMAKDELAGGRP